MRTCVLSTAQSSEKGDVLNPLITGVFLEVRVLAHMCTHTDKRAHARLLIIVSHLRRPTVRPTSRMPSSCSGPSWRSPTSRGHPRPRTSDQQTPALDPPTTTYTTMITTMIMGLWRKTLFWFCLFFKWNRLSQLFGFQQAWGQNRYRGWKAWSVFVSVNFYRCNRYDSKALFIYSRSYIAKCLRRKKRQTGRRKVFHNKHVCCCTQAVCHFFTEELFSSLWGFLILEQNVVALFNYKGVVNLF